MASKKQKGDPQKGAEIVARIKARLDELGISESAAAERMGSDRTTLSTTLRRTAASGRLGPIWLEKLEKILDRSGDWIRHGTEDPATVRWVEVAARYPNLEEAILDLGPRASQEAIEQVRTWALHSGLDLDVHTWRENLLDVTRKLKRAAKTGAAPVRELPDEDDTPPAGRR